MTLVKIKQHHQITLPRKMRSKFSMFVGDYLEIEESSKGFLIKPVKVISPDQEYFYTKEWQKKEAEVDEDIRKGDVFGPFDNVADAIKALKTEKI